MQKHLKLSRILISIFVLLATSYLFIDIYSNVDAQTTNLVLYLQFIPSLIKFLQVVSISSIGFLFVLVLTLSFGRSYCSFLCPLGILQDVFIFISGKFKSRKKRKFRYRKPNKIIWYGIFGIVLITLFFGSFFALNLLDPYSNFGRISSELFRPVITVGNNFLASGLENWRIYTLYQVDLTPVNIMVLIFPLIMITILLVLSIRRGRLYCNSVCPVGALLGLLSKYSFFKIQIDKNNCTHCGKCAITCKAECIDVKNQHVDMTRCVGCYNCLKSCDSGDIRYRSSWLKKSAKRVSHLHADFSKREFLTRGVLYFITMGGIFNLFHTRGYAGGIRNLTGTGSTSNNGKNATPIPYQVKYPVTPPGSLGVTHMKNTCTACQLCVSVCPSQVLKPSFLEYGFTGMQVPFMNFHVSYCNYTCTLCSEVCPTGAILPISREEKKVTQVGKVKFLLQNCVVYTNKTACGSCSEHCPTQAVKMVPYENILTLPETREDICIGCGACEYACPVSPYKAIYVESNFIHQEAVKPEIEKLEPPGTPDDAFPF